MKEKEFLDIYASAPVFTLREVSSLLGSMSYAKQYLNRLKRRGSVLNIGRGLYTLHNDPMVYATHIRYPSYISFISAFQYHGTTTQLPTTVEVVSTETKKYPGVEMLRSSYVWGYGKIEYSGFEVFMAYMEKAVIDSIILERSPIEEIEEALRKCDLALFENHTLSLRVSDMKKVGYVLSLLGVELRDVKERVAEDRNYVRSSYFKGKNEWRVKGDRDRGYQKGSTT